MTFDDWMAYGAVYGGGALGLWIVWKFVQSNLNQHRRYKELLASGFRADHVLYGSLFVALDDDRREMAVIYSDKTLKYSYSRVDTWTHEYNIRGNQQIQHRFVITVLDTEYPRHETRISASECRQWMAKMRAIMAQ